MNLILKKKFFGDKDIVLRIFSEYQNQPAPNSIRLRLLCHTIIARRTAQFSAQTFDMKFCENKCSHDIRDYVFLVFFFYFWIERRDCYFVEKS